MSKVPSGLSIADLEKALEEKRDYLQDLLKKRDQAQKEIDRLDAEIQDAANVDRPIGRMRRGRRRVKNETSLRAVVLDILGKNKKGFSLADLAAKVSETGYMSNAGNFKNVVYQCLYNTDSIIHDDATGCYRLKK